MKKFIAVIVLLASFTVYAVSSIEAHGIKADPNSGAQPTCAVGIRGLVFNVEGASGVADAFKVCMKDASNNYGWVTK